MTSSAKERGREANKLQREEGKEHNEQTAEKRGMAAVFIPCNFGSESPDPAIGVK